MAEPNKRITQRKPIAHTQYFVSLGGTYKATSTTTLLHHPSLLEPDLSRSHPLDINARVKQHLLTPLHFAAMNASADFVLTLVKNGAQVNAVDQHGRTPLRLACNSRRADTIDILVAHGALVDAKELRYALTPLHMAAKSGHVDILNSLIEYGADATSRTSDNRTCLCFAAYGSHLDCITALV
ncbi:ankyrin repeat-containing domain protein, partial [Chytriomyces cf. hyalinus JEL632]